MIRNALRHLKARWRRIMLDGFFVGLVAFFGFVVFMKATAFPQSNEVDLRLVLAADISNSMKDHELSSQRRGYVEALRSPEVIQAVTSGMLGRIAITYIEWSSDSLQTTVVPWTLVEDAQSAEMVAAILEERRFGTTGSTAVGSALRAAGEALNNSPFVAFRDVIDVSGDGENNSGPKPGEVRDFLVGNGVTINAIVVAKRLTMTDANPADIASYYEENVIGGPGAFMVAVDGYKGFAEAIQRKLVMEIAGVDTLPETCRLRAPGTPVERVASLCRQQAATNRDESPVTRRSLPSARPRREAEWPTTKQPVFAAFGSKGSKASDARTPLAGVAGNVW